ncbi:MAG: hypothetical protein AAF587_33730 [Bacteroidota bacterium]
MAISNTHIPHSTAVIQSEYFLPFTPWTRLESVPRAEEFDRVLKAEVHDALWMLTRQWQFGEFKGEDTGTAVKAKIMVESSRLTRMQFGQRTAQAFADHQAPLEAQVEQISVPIDLKRSAQLGKWWLDQLNQRGQAYNTAKELSSSAKAYYHKDMYKALFLALYPVDPPATPDTKSSTFIPEVKQAGNKRLRQYQAAIAGRVMHGGNMYADMTKGGKVFQPQTASLKGVGEISKDHKDIVYDLAIAFRQYCAQFHLQPASQDQSNWVSRQMEYQAACSFPESSKENLVLLADEYPGGQLDWYSFDIDPAPDSDTGLTGTNKSIPEDVITTKLLEVIPAQATFAGMPSPRWWEFEDAYLDFGKMDNDPADLGRILMTEFAFLYSNDWFVVPYKLPVGSFSRVKGIVVTDVFGQKTFVRSAGSGDPDDWSRWNMFSVSVREAVPSGNVNVDRGLFLPPTIAKSHESEQLESISFVRDEMANLVWSVEQAIPDGWGGKLNGFEATNEWMGYLKGLLGLDEEEEENSNGSLSYQLATSVPENWIPFIPVHTDDGNRSIQLQRAAMPRILEGLQTSAIRPRTHLLREGVDEADKQSTPFFLNEEEVPRAGVVVSSHFQRTRWYDGKSVLWLSRKKKTGRGGGSSGLTFDQIKG